MLPACLLTLPPCLAPALPLAAACLGSGMKVNARMASWGGRMPWPPWPPPCEAAADFQAALSLLKSASPSTPPPP